MEQRFEKQRPYLRSVAFRMLGSLCEAEDAVQETWLRLNRSSTDSIDNWDGWTVTVLTRICLDVLRQRKAKTVEPIERDEDLAGTDIQTPNPEQEAAMAEAVGIAVLVVLNTLAPPERLAFVMHDMFDYPFEEIADVLEKSPAAVRQLASRARKRIRGAPQPSAQTLREQEVVSSFLAYLRVGDVHGVLSVLHPDVIRRADALAVPSPGEQFIAGRNRVAEEAATNIARAQFAQVALIDRHIGIVVAPYGRLRVALLCKVFDGTIVEFDVIADPKRLDTLDVWVLPQSRTKSDSGGRMQRGGT